jgi:hypothetical protein
VQLREFGREAGSESRKQGFFLVRGVPFAAHAKVLERRLHGCSLLIGQWPTGCSFGDYAKDLEEVLDPSMTVFEHAEGIFKPTVGLRANMYCHDSHSCYDSIESLRGVTHHAA